MSSRTKWVVPLQRFDYSELQDKSQNHYHSTEEWPHFAQHFIHLLSVVSTIICFVRTALL